MVRVALIALLCACTTHVPSEDACAEYAVRMADLERVCWGAPPDELGHYQECKARSIPDVPSADVDECIRLLVRYTRQCPMRDGWLPDVCWWDGR